MGFPPELWFKEGVELDQGARVGEPPDDRQSLSERLEILFEAIKNERTGEPYTNADIARLSMGDLTEEEVEGIRNGTISNPSIAQVIALADVFGVQPSYFLDVGKEPPLIDEEAIEILRDETVRAIAHKSLHLPVRDRQIVLNIIRQFEGMQETDEGDDAAPEAPG
jgi:transcriptional regulator with XRE-family HTH domain